MTTVVDSVPSKMVGVSVFRSASWTCSRKLLSVMMHIAQLSRAPRKHGYSRWNFVGSTSLRSNKSISGLAAAIFDFPMHFNTPAAILDLQLKTTSGDVGYKTID